MRAVEGKGTLAGAVAAVAAAALGVATSFGIHITTAQHAAILTFCGAVAVAAPLVGSILDHANKQAAAINSTAPAPPTAADVLQQQIDALAAQKAALTK